MRYLRTYLITFVIAVLLTSGIYSLEISTSIFSTIDERLRDVFFKIQHNTLELPEESKQIVLVTLDS